MTCTPIECTNCLTFFHSAGPFNCDPCIDLGGLISTCPLSEGLDNLFHSLGPKLTRHGLEDYRCFYIKNTSETACVRNAVIYLDGTGRESPGKRSGAFIALGVKLQDEVQKVTISGLYPPNQGEYFTLELPSYESFTVYYDPNITKWVGNFQTAIRTMQGFPEVVVTVEGDVPTTISESLNVEFTVDFGGHDSRNQGRKGVNQRTRWNQAAKHQFDLLAVTDNTLTNCSVNVTSVKEGSPVNTIAGITTKQTTPPAGIIFDYYFRGDPIRIGNLKPGDIVPIWVRRTLTKPEPEFGVLARPKQTAKLNDDFVIVIEGTSP